MGLKLSQMIATVSVLELLPKNLYFFDKNQNMILSLTTYFVGHLYHFEIYQFQIYQIPGNG